MDNVGIVAGQLLLNHDYNGCMLQAVKCVFFFFHFLNSSVGLKLFCGKHLLQYLSNVLGSHKETEPRNESSSQMLKNSRSKLN